MNPKRIEFVSVATTEVWKSRSVSQLHFAYYVPPKNREGVFAGNKRETGTYLEANRRISLFLFLHHCVPLAICVSLVSFYSLKDFEFSSL